MIATEPSKTERFIVQMGWDAKPSGENQLAVQVCPFCKNTNHKFYINQDSGLWQCKKCEEAGNLYQLKQRLGIVVENTESIKDAAFAKTAPPPLPNVEALHWRLFNDKNLEDILDYLIAERKFSMDVIEKYKIGADLYEDKKWIVFPYLDAAGNPLFVKWRTLPPLPKSFRSSPGRVAPLFNAGCMKEGMEELILVEGESDTLSLLSNGYTTVIGVPGAAMKKAEWLEEFERINPKNVYLLYDNDKVGQKSAKEMAAKIGIDKCKNILLPFFELSCDDEGNVKAGKDINEWFITGHTLDELLALKAEAKQFDVQGVQALAEVIDELIEDIDSRGTEPQFTTPWPSLNKKIGGFEEGDLIGWMAEGKVGKTTTVLNLLNWYAANFDYPCLLHCLEMPPKRLVRKWASHVTQTDDTPGASKLTVETMNASMEYARGMKSDLLFGYQKKPNTEEVFELFYQAKRRYGVKIFGFDNLQILCRSVEHASQETARITKDFKAIAMELSILLHLIIQPKQVPRGTIISGNDGLGSSAISKDVDLMVCMHRERVGQIKEGDFHGFLDTDENFAPQMLMRADLTRYANGGCCTLFMDGATSTVREMGDEDRLVAIPKLGIAPIQAEGITV